MIRMLRLARTDLARSLGTYRWLVAALVVFAATWLSLEYVQYDYDTDRARAVNLWDGPPGLLSNIFFVLFVFVLGFVILSGDLYVRERTLGTSAATMLRARSRGEWWRAKIVALGGLALVYSALVFAVVLAVGTVRLGWGWGASPTAEQAVSSSAALYSRWAAIPMPAFVSIIMVYTAFALWAVGAVVLLVSTLVPHPLTPAVTALVWVLLDSSLISEVSKRAGPGRVDPVYQVSYASHFQATPWGFSFAVIAVTLATTVALGTWRLRHTDL